MPALLTDDWFSTVEQLTLQAGDLNLPPSLENLGVNLVVNNLDGTQTDLSLIAGKIHKGLSDQAKTTLAIDAETLRKVFLEFDMQAAMQAFMSGKIKVQGDMSQLMSLHTVKPSSEQKALYKKILENTTQ